MVLVLVPAIASIGLGLLAYNSTRNPIVSLSRDVVFIDDDRIVFRHPYRFVMGLVNIVVERFIQSNGKPRYRVMKMEFVKIADSSYSNHIDLNTVCSAAPSSVVRYNGSRLSLRAPAVLILSPIRFRNTAILCLDITAYKWLKNKTTIVSGYQDEDVSMDVEISGSILSTKAKYTSKRRDSIRNVRFFKVYLRVCLNDVCREDEIFTESRDSERTIKLWNGFGRRILMLNLGRLSKEAPRIFKELEDIDRFAGLCLDEAKLILRLDVPYKSVYSEADLRLCPKPFSVTDKLVYPMTLRS